MSQALINIRSHLQIQTLCSRHIFKSGNDSRLNPVAHGLMSMRSFSSKRKNFKFRVTSEKVSDSEVIGGKQTGYGDPTVRVHRGSGERDKATVCNAINGHVNASVSHPNHSRGKGMTKTSTSVSAPGKDADSKRKENEDRSGNKEATTNINVRNAKTLVRRDWKSGNKKQAGKESVQNSLSDEAAKSNDKVKSAKSPIKMNQELGDNKHEAELSDSSAAALLMRGSEETSKENSINASGTSELDESNSTNSSSGGSEISEKIRPLYPPSGKSVVVVESVTKARVIQSYLGNMYEVLPSHGHLRDLAGRSGSVRPDDDFSMVWEVPSSAWTHLKSIKVALNGAENLILASDSDCEGEAIAWHITEMLQQQDALRKNITVARVVFHEITESSIKSALQAPREIDKNLVNAYLARRALDYLIGFNISPLLWKKLPGCQSAGRVQSAALALICDRELEIEKFKKKEYWTIGVEFHNTCLDSLRRKASIFSHLTHFNSQKLDRMSIGSRAEAEEIEKRLSSSNFEVLATRISRVVKNPPMPYIKSVAFYSLLYNEASSNIVGDLVIILITPQAPHVLILVAQGLYEGIKLSNGEATGLITYMRTDGVHISDEAAENINSFVKERYGERFAPKSIRKYFRKVKNDQEVHEAIRPTDIRRLPKIFMGLLDDDSLKLYTLIWTRTMACQMEPATINTIQVDIGNMEGDMAFRSVASRIAFPGYREVYKDSKAASAASEVKEVEANESSFKVLSDLQVKDPLFLVNVDLRENYTKPPAHYSEGTLLKKLEDLGIGRPSTYASIMKVLQDRNYVTTKNQELHPEFRGRMVSVFLHHLFSEVSDYSFTADMESELDNVSAGRTEWRGLLKDYWSRFSKHCDLASNTDIRKVEKMLEKTFSHFLFPSADSESRVCPSCSIGTLKFKVIGSDYFIGCDRNPKCKYTACTIYAEEDEDVPSEKLEKSFPPKFLGCKPGSDEKILLKNGPYGYYVQLGEDKKGFTPKRASVSEVKDLESITLDDAIELLQYPISLGNHPDDEHPVFLKHSKFGFSIKHRRTIAPVPKNMNPKKITLATGLKLLLSKNAKKSGRPKSKPKPAEEDSWD
ncbi:uncharacterized protein A4U43_C03F27810 [Asparagus officinalis]|uniref:DNA topoisomerase n=1 Tax=Asparagus officinalis TaxID=4686 RepID=A0A5P1FIL7_ASPOF|nr:uncharacterized protein A4U43_C03F27810 [Asparagus officinalis]